jgi:hypothetical protein
MFLRSTTRQKDGKLHRYFSVVENRRLRGGRHVQKTLLYLGEINDTQKAAWAKTIDAIDGRTRRQVALFPEDREVPEGVKLAVQVRLAHLELHRPRQWGACWLACGLDPEKTIIYRQSDVPETFELTAMIMAFTPKGLMNRAHAYKAVVAQNRDTGQQDDDKGMWCPENSTLSQNEKLSQIHHNSGDRQGSPRRDFFR